MKDFADMDLMPLEIADVNLTQSKTADLDICLKKEKVMWSVQMDFPHTLSLSLTYHHHLQKLKPFGENERSNPVHF